MSDSLDVTLTGFAETAASLRATPKQIDRACSRAVRATARDIRRTQIVVDLQRDTGIKRAELNRRLNVRYDKPKRGREHYYPISHSARIVPSANGVKVNMFRSHRMEIVDEKHNRARGYVPWVNGKEKLVAGFISSGSKQKRLLRSKNHAGKLPNLRTAIAPSVASMIKDYYQPRQQQAGLDLLQDNVDKELEKELKK